MNAPRDFQTRDPKVRPVKETLKPYTARLRHYVNIRKITSGQVFTRQVSTKSDFPGCPALCTIPQFITQHQVHCLSLSFHFLSLSALSLFHIDFCLSFSSRFVLMLHCFVMLQSHRVNIFSLCYSWERSFFPPSWPFPSWPSPTPLLINTHSLQWACSL